MTVKLTFENFYQVAEEGADAGVVGNAAGEEGGGRGCSCRRRCRDSREVGGRGGGSC